MMITISATINAPIEKVWERWTKPEHITKWAFASDDWEAPFAENDVRTGGRFTTRMAAKDKSASFDFGGVYTDVKEKELIEYDMSQAPDEPNARHVKTVFEQTPEGVKITQSFDPETTNSEEMQRSGWQGILDNFKKYAES
jgi:uncharacterized protein YndB with AHSA1/START domain